MDSVQWSYKKGTLLSSLYTRRNIYLNVINFKLTSTSFCQVLLKFNLIVFLCARMKQEEEKKEAVPDTLPNPLEILNIKFTFVIPGEEADSLS